MKRNLAATLVMALATAGVLAGCGGGGGGGAGAQPGGIDRGVARSRRARSTASAASG